MSRGIWFGVAAWLLAQGYAQAQVSNPLVQNRIGQYKSQDGQAETLPPLVGSVADRNSGTTIVTMQPGGKKDGAIAPAPGGCGTCQTCQQPCESCGCGPEPCGPCGRVWVSGEYLLWWQRGANVPPLVTTTTLPGPSITEAGFLGANGTTVAFGDQRIDNQSMSGWRLTAGYWLNECQTIGIQARYFGFATQHTDASFGSDEYPALYRPFYNVQTQRPGVFVISEPAAPDGFTRLGYTGQIDVSSYSRFWGTDADMLFNVCCGCCYRVDLLGGWRYLRLQEGLRIHDIETNLNAQGFTVDATDLFNTTNVFNGGDIGITGEYRSGKFVLSGLAKLALGATTRTVNIDGFSNISPGPGAATVSNLPGGVLAQPSNIGSSSSTQFSAVPEFGVNLAYQVTPNIRATLGYTFIYWGNVARPGDQIDTRLNLSQFPSTAGPGTLIGESAPGRSVNDASYWIQGINVGLEFRF